MRHGNLGNIFGSLNSEGEFTILVWVRLCHVGAASRGGPRAKYPYGDSAYSAQSQPTSGAPGQVNLKIKAQLCKNLSSIKKVSEWPSSFAKLTFLPSCTVPGWQRI